VLIVIIEFEELLYNHKLQIYRLKIIH